MEHLINKKLIENPLNWIIVVLMVAFGGFLVDSFVRWNATLKA